MEGLAAGVKGIGVLNGISKVGAGMSKVFNLADEAVEGAGFFNRNLSKAANAMKGAAGILDETKTAQTLLNAQR